jgi:hypothetical protein
VGKDSARFRARAVQCRTLADAARDDESRRSLSDMAQELDDEAAKMEAEEAERPDDA